MRKINWNKTFRVDENVAIECGWQNTSYGFRHLAVVRRNGCRVVEAKCCYYNRTWESYTYQSVVHKAIEKMAEKTTREQYIKAADAIGDGQSKEFFQGFKMMAVLGEVMGRTGEEKTALKKQALAAVPGIVFPEGFDQLDAEEQRRRIDGALKML